MGRVPLRLARGGLPAPAHGRLPLRQDQRVLGKATVFARRDGLFPDTTDWPAQGWRDVFHTGEPLRAGLPMCTVVTEGTDEAECYARLVTQAQVVWNRV